MSVDATNTVKTKTIRDMPLYDDPYQLLTAYTFVSEDPERLERASVEDIYKSFEYNYAPTYEQSYCNVSLVGRKLYYPAMCQNDYEYGDIRWRVIFLNQQNRTAATKFYVKDQSGATLSAQMLQLSDGYEYTTIDWLSPVQGYLSVNNAAAAVDVLLRGYVGEYPDIKPRTFVSANIEAIGNAYRHARTVGRGAFMDSQLAIADLPCLERIEKSAFCRTKLDSVDFPRVTWVGDRVFLGCGQLVNVKLPNAVTFGDSTFSGCKSIVSISLPAAEVVGNKLFTNCDALEYANLPKASWSLDQAISGMHCGQQMFYQLNALTAVGLSAIQCFSDKMFYGCKNLKSISCDWNAVRFIDDQSFYQCENLMHLESMPNVLSVNQGAFALCRNLSSISLPNCIAAQSQCFRSCNNLSSADVHNLQYAGSRLFEQCGSLLSIDLPNLKSIAYSAFKQCRNVRHIDIHSAELTSIPHEAFYNCKNLSSLILPPLDGSIKTIESDAFSYCNKININYWDGVLSVLSCAFQYGCTGYMYGQNAMSFPDAVYFAPSAFYKSDVQALTCWEVSSIGAKAFAGSSLWEIHFNNSNNKVPSCPATAFDNISQTVAVYVPESMLTSFKNNTNWKAMTTAKTYNDDYDTEGHYKIEIIGYY